MMPNHLKVGGGEDLATDAFNKNAAAKRMDNFFMGMSSKKIFLFFYCNTQLWQNYGVVVAIVARLWQMWQIL